MKKWILIIFFAICLIACGGSGGDSNGNGSGDIEPEKVAAIVAQGDVDCYWMRVGGVLEIVSSQLEYHLYRTDFPAGVYFCQIFAELNGQLDYPVDLNLIITKYGSNKWRYEILPECWEESFDQNHLILDMEF